MNKVFLSLGSNIEAPRNIKAAIAALQSTFQSVESSPVYESEAVGFNGDNFLNLVVKIETDLALDVLVKKLKQLEDQLGRERSGPKFSSRVIDMDVIFYNDACGKVSGIELPRYEVYENAYVLLPMKQLAPDFVDPKTSKTMAELWDSLADVMGKQKLWKYQSTDIPSSRLE